MGSVALGFIKDCLESILILRAIELIHFLNMRIEDEGLFDHVGQDYLHILTVTHEILLYFGVVGK
jgi:hypothetical protein